MKPRILTTAVLTAFTAGSLLFLFDARADITTGLVGYWTFDDSNGSTASSTAADFSTNNNTGTLTGFSDGTFMTMWTPDSWFTNALLFNQNGDTGDYVSVPDIPQIDIGSTTKNFTIAAWVNATAAANLQGGILCKGVSGSENYCMDVSSSKFRVFTRNASGGTSITCSANVGPTVGTWVHVVGTYAITNSGHPSTEVIYINGVSNNVATTTFTGMVNASHVLSIGNRPNASGTYNIPFIGTLDDVRLYNRALTASDVLQLYTNNATAGNHGPTPIVTQPRSVTCYLGDTPVFSVVPGSTTNSFVPLFYQWQFDGGNIAGATTTAWAVTNAQAGNVGMYSVIISNYAGFITSTSAMLTLNSLPTANTTIGLVGWWKFDDGSGSHNAADSASGNSGMLISFADGSFTSMWTGGLMGGALAFNQDASGQDVIAVPSLGTPAPAALDFSTNGTTGEPVLTLSAWVMGAAKQTNGAGLIARGTGNGGEQYIMDIENGFYRFFVRDTNGAAWNAQSSVPPSGVWQHVVGVLNGTNGIMNLYVNGVLATPAVAPFSLLANSHEMTIGNRQPSTGAYGNAFTGLLDDVRVYNRDLTSADVMALYQQGAAYPAITSSTPPASMPPVTATNIYSMFAGDPIPTFSLTASGSPTLTYSWYTNGGLVTGANGTSLTLSGLTAGFWTNNCVVANTSGSATNTWIINVIDPSTAPPYPQAVVASSPVAYLRLQEPDDLRGDGNAGRIANDYVGGHNGVYTNVNLGLTPGYNVNGSSTDPGASSAQFGVFKTSNSYVGQIQGINFAAAAGNNVNLSVEAWVKAGTTPGSGSEIVNQGEFGVDDMFTLGFNSSSPFQFRFYAREVGLSPATATSSVAPDGNWHHLVGVLDETDGLELIYVDGQLSKSIGITTAGGLAEAANTAVIIGSGTTNNTTYTKQADCQISDVAIYNYALTAAEVAAHYNAVGTAPTFTIPSSITIDQGDTLVVAPTINSGTPPLSFSWFDNNAATVIATTATLTVPGIINSDTYTLTVTNGISSSVSPASVSVTVVSNLEIFTDITPTSATVYAGVPVTFSITAYGELPVTYQWYNQSGQILGANSSNYTAITTVGTSTYYCIVGNSTPTSPLTSQTATLTGIALPNSIYDLAVLSNNPVAYWRLNEADNQQNNGNAGVIAYDYVGQHDATYNNVELGLTGNNVSDPDTAALFGVFATPNSYAGEINNSGSGIPNIDFAKTLAAGSAEFSVEAWVKSTNSQANNAGIVSRGYDASGGEQFTLGCSGNHFRFEFRDGVNQVITCTSGVSDEDGNWHHLVGVCDQINGGAHLYVDGVDTADADTEPGKGLIDPSGTTDPAASLVSIGSWAASKTAGTLADQYVGTIAEVALYTNALTATQIMTHFNLGTKVESLTITDLGNGTVQVNWSFGTLQGAPNLSSTFTNIPGATSPYVVPATSAQQFFRVQEQ